MNVIYIILISLLELAYARANFVESLDINSHYANGVIRRLHKAVGKCVRFRCHLPEHDNSKILWRFKKCGDYHGNLCEINLNTIPIVEDNLATREEDLNDTIIWTPMECKQPCKMLNINHLSEENSGLYQCYLQQNEEISTYNAHVVRLYELVVTDIPEPNFPEIIEDFPNFVTSQLHEKVVLQCKARSKEGATILWLKQTDNNSNTTIQDTNNTYEALKSSGEMLLSNHIYVSKLVISKATLEDKGTYECVAVNNIGYRHRSIYLNVLEVPADYILKNDIPMYSLFIIPISFLFLPLMFWLCYVYYKKYAHSKDLCGTGNNKNIGENDQLAKNLMISVNIVSAKGETNYRPLIVL